MTMNKDERSLVGYSLGKYEIHEEIGRGGMGVVYKGYDPLLDRYLAVKVLAPHLVWEREFVERFLREARAAARLKHPNIVTIYDVGQHEGWYYFVMEYVEGVTLDAFVNQHGLLPFCDVMNVTAAMASALDYAHGHGLIHRDIKPGNIIVSKDGQIVLTDFGIARAAREQRMTSTGVILGTPEYMSPEQAKSEPMDARSDLYSLAMVTYQLLSGVSPYAADSILSMLYKVVHEPLPPIRTQRPDLPEEVEAVLQKALAKDPAQRYSTVMAFCEALYAALGPRATEGASFFPESPATPLPRPITPRPQRPDTPPSQPPVTPPAESARRRMPVWVWAILGVIALLGIVIGGGIATGMFGAAATPDVVHTPPATGAPPVTGDPTASLEPTSTASPTTMPDDTQTQTPASTSTPTRTPTATRAPTRTPRVTLAATHTATPEATATPGVTATPQPTTPTPSPTPGAAAPTATPRTTSPGAIITFEEMGTWRRGDQPYGELSQTQEQVYGGSYAAKLSYDFPGVGDDFVVFSQPRNLVGAPNRFSAWVYGDGSGHFLNLWIQDAQNQIWSVHLGQVGAAGWRQMSGTLAPGRPWPDGHVSGPDNGIVDYPVRFYALVLDRPGRGLQKGHIYIDDISAWHSTDVAAATPQATVTPGATAAPTAAPVAVGEIGRIVFTVQTGETYYLYSTDPNWSQMQEIGQTDKNNSTCAGGGTASTLTGVTVSLYGVNKCGITARTDVCPSPNGQYKVITNQIADSTLTLSVYTADETQHWAYYQGQLNRTVGVQWTPNSQHVIFGVGSIVNRIQVGVDGYHQVTANVDNTWPAQLSPDGSMIYYLQAVGSSGALDIFAVNLDGSGLRNLTNAPIAHKLCPRWRR